MRLIRWSRPAQNDIGKLDPPVARRILAALDHYAETGHGDIVRLKDSPGEFRLRVGDWRVRFREPKPDVVEILRVRHRREAYR